MKVIIEIEGGMLRRVYSDCKERISVELLDYDNYAVATDDAPDNPDAAEEAAYYKKLEQEIEAGISSGNLTIHW